MVVMFIILLRTVKAAQKTTSTIKLVQKFYLANKQLEYVKIKTSKSSFNRYFILILLFC